LVGWKENTVVVVLYFILFYFMMKNIRKDFLKGGGYEKSPRLKNYPP
jgi:hypothetical protein